MIFVCFFLKGALTLRKHEGSTANTTAATPDNEKAQYAVLTSESQIKVITLPNQTCIYQQNLTDPTIAKASIVVVNCKQLFFFTYIQCDYFTFHYFSYSLFKALAYLTCYMSNGNYIVYNLPNLSTKTTMNLNSQTFLLKERDLMYVNIKKANIYKYLNYS